MRWLVAGVALLLAGVVGSSAAEVARARQATPPIMADALAQQADGLGPEQLPEGWLEALLAVEDPAFYEHGGVDLRTPGAGITTITQALVKQLYFDRFRPGLAKWRQSLIAWAVLDRAVDKDTQLRLFLNRVYLGSAGGEALYGFPDAAQAYFGRPFSELRRDQYLALVAMVISPTTFHVRDRPESNRRRVARIEDVLAGNYRPAGLMDLYYGPLTPDEQASVPVFSYFGP